MHTIPSPVIRVKHAGMGENVNLYPFVSVSQNLNALFYSCSPCCLFLYFLRLSGGLVFSIRKFLLQTISPKHTKPEEMVGLFHMLVRGSRRTDGLSRDRQAVL